MGQHLPLPSLCDPGEARRESRNEPLQSSEQSLYPCYSSAREGDQQPGRAALVRPWSWECSQPLPCPGAMRLLYHHVSASHFIPHQLNFCCFCSLLSLPQTLRLLCAASVLLSLAFLLFTISTSFCSLHKLPSLYSPAGLCL